MKFGSPSLGKSLLIALMVITGVAIALDVGNNHDIRGKAADQQCLYAGVMCGGSVGCCAPLVCNGATGSLQTCGVPDAAPTPSFQQKLITSGTCTAACYTIPATCDTVGTDSLGKNGLKMSYDNYSLCKQTPANCGTIIKTLKVPAKVTCLSGKPEWVVCSCKLNPLNK